jgi:hypothetical protein
MRITEVSLDTHAELVPRWLRVPAAVRYSGLSKSYLYPAISEGKIRSACLRAHPEATRGIRLVDRFSLDEFLVKHIENSEGRLARNREKPTIQAETLANAQARPQEEKANIESEATRTVAQPDPNVLRGGLYIPLD